MTTDLPTDGPVEPPTLEVSRLTVDFAVRAGTFTAARDVSFTLRRGRTLCLVGESGSGKSVTARALMQLVDAPGRISHGAIRLASTGAPIDIAKLEPRGKAIRAIRGRRVSMIFQEPMSSLSPVHTIGSQIVEVLRLHLKLDPRQARARTIELLRRVEIPDPEQNIDRYTFEFSGGMRQRAMIAMALACNPEVLIADEPTTALDVTTQAEVLDLISEMQRELGMAMLLITHDMGVVAEVADDVAVMFRGQIVETGTVDEVFHNPQHPYTRRLLSSALKLERSSDIKEGIEPDRTAPPILSVRGLGKTFLPRKSLFNKAKTVSVRAVDDVSFDLFSGESLGIVGESGSGKTTLGRLILRTIEPTDGRVTLATPTGDELDLRGLDRTGLRAVHQQIRLIFQDPFASLNPRMTVRQIIGDPLHVNRVPRVQIETRVAELMSLVGMDPESMERYPHAFSGGQRQRIGIARALAVNPRILIADEATSALDVSIRSQILDLLLQLQQQLGLSFLFISHDIGVVRYFCDRVAVMRRGKLVEIGTAQMICARPVHPYTQALISAVPSPDPRHKRMRMRTRSDP